MLSEILGDRRENEREFRGKEAVKIYPLCPQKFCSDELFHPLRFHLSTKKLKENISAVERNCLGGV